METLTTKNNLDTLSDVYQLDNINQRLGLQERQLFKKKKNKRETSTKMKLPST